MSTGERRIGDLTEAALIEWRDDLPRDLREGELIIKCGSTAVELVAARIVATPGAPLYGVYKVEGEPAMAGRHWKALAIA